MSNHCIQLNRSDQMAKHFDKGASTRVTTCVWVQEGRAGAFGVAVACAPQRRQQVAPLLAPGRFTRRHCSLDSPACRIALHLPACRCVLTAILYSLPPLQALPSTHLVPQHHVRECDELMGRIATALPAAALQNTEQVGSLV